jgi:hypothetical protein
LDPLSERNTEHAFLQRVIAQDAGEEGRQLQDRLAQAEHHDQYLRRALFLMGLLIMLSLAGLGYCAILLPGIFCDPTHVVIRSLRYLGVASLVSWVGFFGDFLWHRTAVGRLHRECQRQVLALAEGPPRELDASGLAVHFRVQPPLQNHDDHPAMAGSATVTTT